MKTAERKNVGIAGHAEYVPQSRLRTRDSSVAPAPAVRMIPCFGGFVSARGGWIMTPSESVVCGLYFPAFALWYEMVIWCLRDWRKKPTEGGDGAAHGDGKLPYLKEVMGFLAGHGDKMRLNGDNPTSISLLTALDTRSPPIRLCLDCSRTEQWLSVREVEERFGVRWRNERLTHDYQPEFQASRKRPPLDFPWPHEKFQL
ncbi:hypothetical protein L218DRAFT_945807 [Marasmius fiardii PR-910]|nr:hypothetical protein L218DRAFT_945807 [Marasmius fiardii PR-910]